MEEGEQSEHFSIKDAVLHKQFVVAQELPKIIGIP